MTVEIKDVWGTEVGTLCETYNRATREGDVDRQVDVTRQLVDLAKQRDWRVALRSAQALEKIARVNPTPLKTLVPAILEAYETGAFQDKGARDTIIIALRWVFPSIDPKASTTDIISAIKQAL